MARDSLRGEGEAQESHSVADPDVLPEDGSHLSYKAFRNRLLEQGERQYFTDVASRAKGSLHEACRLSGLSKSRLYFFLQKYNISLKSNPS